MGSIAGSALLAFTLNGKAGLQTLFRLVSILKRHFARRCGCVNQSARLLGDLVREELKSSLAIISRLASSFQEEETCFFSIP